MKEIVFPAFNLKFEINSIAITVFDIDIYWYAILITLAFIIALVFCKKDDSKYGINFDSILELMIRIIPVSIISARLYYVLFKFDYYIQNPIEILNIRNGGLAIYGGIIGGVIAILIYCRKSGINILNMLDYIVPYLALGQAIGRWGNFFNGEAYGIQTNSIFRMGIIENNSYIEVVPTFLYESICNFIIFIILYSTRNKRKYKGQLTFLYLSLYGLVRCIIEGIRIDSLMLGSLRISQLISAILFVTFTVLLLYNNYVRILKK